MSNMFIEIGKDVINVRSVRYITIDDYGRICVHLDKETMFYEYPDEKQRDESFNKIRRRLGVCQVS